jgi:hypothetical protein
MQDGILDGGTSILNAPEMRVGRNDPCPCGSGQKFKKCHGAVIAVQSLSKRECGPPSPAATSSAGGCVRTARSAGRTGAPFFYEQRGERFGFGPPAFQQEMLARLERGERLW